MDLISHNWTQWVRSEFSFRFNGRVPFKPLTKSRDFAPEVGDGSKWAKFGGGGRLRTRFQFQRWIRTGRWVGDCRNFFGVGGMVACPPPQIRPWSGDVSKRTKNRGFVVRCNMGARETSCFLFLGTTQTSEILIFPPPTFPELRTALVFAFLSPPRRLLTSRLPPFYFWTKILLLPFGSPSKSKWVHKENGASRSGSCTLWVACSKVSPETGHFFAILVDDSHCLVPSNGTGLLNPCKLSFDRGVLEGSHPAPSKNFQQIKPCKRCDFLARQILARGKFLARKWFSLLQLWSCANTSLLPPTNQSSQMGLLVSVTCCGTWWAGGCVCGYSKQHTRIACYEGNTKSLFRHVQHLAAIRLCACPPKHCCL